jgi:hypothetical protein
VRKLAAEPAKATRLPVTPVYSVMDGAHPTLVYFIKDFISVESVFAHRTLLTYPSSWVSLSLGGASPQLILDGGRLGAALRATNWCL